MITPGGNPICLRCRSIRGPGAHVCVERCETVWVELKYGDAGMIEQGSLEERLRRAEHDAGLLEIGTYGRSSHCWLCRKAWEDERDAGVIRL